MLMLKQWARLTLYLKLTPAVIPNRRGFQNALYLLGWRYLDNVDAVKHKSSEQVKDYRLVLN